MEYTIGAFFVEREASDVDGFFIIDANERQGYRIAEKWDRPYGEPVWNTYWRPEDDLLERVAAGKCELFKQVGTKELRGVCNLAGVEAGA